MAINFDAEAFLTGFFGETANIIKTKSAEAKEYKKEVKDLATRNLAEVATRKSKRDAGISIAMNAKALGASEEQVMAAAMAGPTALSAFYTNLSDMAAELDVNKLDPEIIAERISMSGDMSMTDMDLETLMNRQFGLDTKGVSAEAPKLSVMDRLFNKKATEKVDYELGQQKISGDMSYTDVNAIAAQAEYETLDPTATFSMRPYNDKKVYDLTDATKLRSNIGDALKLLKDDRDYNEIQLTLNTLVGGELTTEQAARKDELLAQKKAMESDIISPILDEYADYYGDNFTVPNEYIKYSRTPEAPPSGNGLLEINEANIQYITDANGVITGATIMLPSGPHTMTAEDAIKMKTEREEAGV